MKGGFVLLFVAMVSATYEIIEEDICCLLKEVGPCKAAMPRWYYNVETGACEKFTYGGCQGNKNNFMNRCDCQKCCGDKKDICCLPMKVGKCRAAGAIRRWYYNSTNDACQEFKYGGSHGNKNNFEKKCQCEEKCLKK